MEGIPKKEKIKGEEEGEWEDWLDDFFNKPVTRENQRDYLAEEIESVGNFFKGVCDRIATTNPDHVVFLDAGARAFGIPFVKYMRIQHEQERKAEYWDDDRLRAGAHDIPEGFVGQHVVFIDDVIWNGRNLKAIDLLSKEQGFTYEYIALSKHSEHEKRLDLTKDFPEYQANDFSGQYIGGNLAGKQRNSLYIRDADAEDKLKIRDAVVSYQNAILETMLKGSEQAQ